jgi:hypothetical protein
MYQNGKIYKIVSDNTDKIYIGSTCNPLYKRLWQHKTSYKTFQKTNKYMSSHEILKFEDCKIILIEDFPCERKEQLIAKERYHIELNKNICVNKVIPTRTNKEYRQQNRDKILEKKKEYYEQNRDKIREQQTMVIICECGSKSTKQHICRHYKTIKHIKWVEQNQS